MKEENEYVWLDGMLLKEEHLVKLSMNAGCFTVAEHYLCALLAHGLMCVLAVSLWQSITCVRCWRMG